MFNLTNLTMGGRKKDSLPPVPDSERSGIHDRGPAEPEDVTNEAIPYREPGELQDYDIVEAFRAEGFPSWMSVTATLERKSSRIEKNEPNEDNVILDAETGLIGVADGLGSGKEGNPNVYGREASKAIEAALPVHFSEALKQAADIPNKKLIDTLSALQAEKLGALGKEIQDQRRREIASNMELIVARDPELLRKAFALIDGLQKTNADVQITNGQSAAALGVIHESANGKRFAIVAGVGDCGAYKRREDGSMRDLLSEDSLYNHLRLSGRLTTDLIERMKMAPTTDFELEIAPNIKRTFSWKKLNTRMTQALGGPEITPALAIIEIRDGEELLFVSDGIKDKFENVHGETNLEKFSKTLGKGSTDLEQLDNLREEARETTTIVKEEDDISAVRVRINKADGKELAA